MVRVGRRWTFLILLFSGRRPGNSARPGSKTIGFIKPFSRLPIPGDGGRAGIKMFRVVGSCYYLVWEIRFIGYCWQHYYALKAAMFENAPSASSALLPHICDALRAGRAKNFLCGDKLGTHYFKGCLKILLVGHMCSVQFLRCQNLQPISATRTNSI